VYGALAAPHRNDNLHRSRGLPPPWAPQVAQGRWKAAPIWPKINCNNLVYKLTMWREAASGRINLAHHRIVARALRRDARLLEEARGVIEAWFAGNAYPPSFAKEWRRLLSAPASVVGEEISRHTPEAERLRGSSPFALIPSRLLTREQVQRFWRMSAFYAIRVLQPSEYGDYAAHLKKLSKHDRVLRFCQPVTDRWIDRFVASIGQDAESIVLGHYDSELGLDGALDVALVERDDGRFAETGLSVLPEARHRGIGFHLLQRGLLWARNRGASRYYSLCTAGNQIMFKLARAYQMQVSFSDEGVEGIIAVNPLTLRSLSLEILEDQIAEWDYNLKAHRAAFSFVAGRAVSDRRSKTDLARLVQLAAVGQTDIIATYVIVFRYALIRSGVSPEDHGAALAALRAKLEPLMARDPDLWTFARGLPTASDRHGIRYCVWRHALE
jgi:GNAT superfamily N-acetyltransferase